MIPSKINHSQGRLFESRLIDQLNPKHELYKLAQRIDWEFFEEEFETLYTEGQGQPPKPIRLMVGLLMLQQIYGLSDDLVVQKWVENPYWQFFCGYDFFEWQFPIDSSSLVRWRKRLGEKGLEKILQATIKLAVETKTVKTQSFKKVIVDTTVMPKNVTYPTDAKLYAKGCEILAKAAKKEGIALRQSYERLSKRTLVKVARYAHARQLKRAAREKRRLKTYLGRLYRDITRKTQGTNKLEEQLKLIERLLKQKKVDKNKLYSLHEPHVRCIAKGKAHKKYEFGCKVSLVITHKEGLLLSSHALHNNPYDGHTLKGVLEKAEEISSKSIKKIFVDKGYRGHQIKDREVFISGSRKNATRWIKKCMKRRQAIEPHIGHIKREGKLERNYLKGQLGDENNALLCGVGHNLRMILRKLRKIFAQIFYLLYSKEWLKKNIVFVVKG